MFRIPLMLAQNHSFGKGPILGMALVSRVQVGEGEVRNLIGSQQPVRTAAIYEGNAATGLYYFDTVPRQRQRLDLRFPQNPLSLRGPRSLSAPYSAP